MENNEKPIITNLENSNDKDETKFYTLIEKIDGTYEITNQAFTVFSSFKNKRLTLTRVFGENILELSNSLSSNNSFEEIIKNNSSTHHSKIIFSYQEIVNDSILVILYNVDDSDLSLRVLSSLLCSSIIYNLDNKEVNEREIVDNVSFLPHCVLDQVNSDNSKSYIELNFEVEEIFPSLVFLTRDKEVPIFKSEFLSSQFINKTFISNNSNLKSLSSTLYKKKFRNYFFTGVNIYALTVSKFLKFKIILTI